MRIAASILASALVGALAFVVAWLLSGGQPSIAFLVPLCAGAAVVDFVAGMGMRVRVPKKDRIQL